MRSKRFNSPFVLAAVGAALVLAAWVVATRPFEGPDETSHYLRALTIARGELLGPRVAYRTTGLTPFQLSFVQADARGVRVPARLSPPHSACLNGTPDSRGSCVEATSTGDYYPPAYLLPALALSVAHSTDTALWLSRFVSALPCLAFILLAGVLLGPRQWSLVGMLLAISPMVLFASSVINPSGLEITASLALTAAAIRVAREPAEVATWVWAATAVAGAITILSWQVGPLFALFDLALGAALLRREQLARLARDSRVRWAAATLLVAAAVWFVYTRISGVAHTPFGVTPIRGALGQGVDVLPAVLREAVGTFGNLNVPLPLIADIVWWIGVLALAAAALWLADRRERLVMWGSLILAFAFPVLAYAWVQRHSGFSMQGRYVLPVLMPVPLLAGEIVSRHAPATGHRRWAAPVAIAGIALFEAYAWWYGASHAAENSGALGFYAHANWSPPLGWILWIVVLLLGTAALLGCAASLAARGSRPAFAGDHAKLRSAPKTP